jgi:hypothetical protein
MERTHRFHGSIIWDFGSFSFGNVLYYDAAGGLPSPALLEVAVAQIPNLPYRRFPVGKPLASTETRKFPTPADY